MSVYVQDPWTSAQWDRERRTGMMYNNELQDEREREKDHTATDLGSGQLAVMNQRYAIA